MSVKVFLDDIDITSALNRQVPLPAKLEAGVFPDNTHSGWYDLWTVIQENPTLKENYHKASVHQLTLVDSNQKSYTAHLILRTKYTCRNR